MHTLLIENVSDAFLQDFVALANTAKATISEQSAECPICKAHDYTLGESLDAALAESLAMSQNPQAYKTYKTMEEFRAALDAD